MSSVLTVREGLGGATVPDTYLDSTNPNTNYGSASPMTCGFLSGKGSAVYRCLMQFDLSGLLPAGAWVIQAELKLYANAAATSAEPVKLHRLTEANWTETGATWNTYDGTNNWWTGGGGDFDSSLFAGTSLPTSIGTWTIGGLKELVDDALRNRGGVLRLLAKRTTESGTDGYAQVRTGEHATESERPELTVVYQELPVRRRRMERY